MPLLLLFALLALEEPPSRAALLQGHRRASDFLVVLGASDPAVLEEMRARARRLGARALPLEDGMIPLEDRYRLGGTGNLRGFRRDAVGPRNEVAQVTVACGGLTWMPD